MIGSVLKKIVGSKNDRELKRLQQSVELINALEPEIKGLSDAELSAKTLEFRDRLREGATLDELLPEAFAVVREAAVRVLGMRHFDVQLIGGMVLHAGKIAEMKTGEGKTLMATLPVYLNALAGKGVHVVTVNDYLAKRDAEWMGQVYNFLGLEVDCVVHGLSDAQRKAAYRADITYGTNNEFGFDYLRDNMKFALEDYVQRDLYYAIVDEVDSILIDEARTPLIISGPSNVTSELYYAAERVIPRLQKGEMIENRDGNVGGRTVRTYTGDFTVDEKSKTATLTEEGVLKVEKLLDVENLYEPANMPILHHVNQALRAHAIFKRDVDYVVKDGEVIIVDEFTGRLMPGRRWSDGQHQAIEAKEGLKIEKENQTLATITFQNYFRMYEKLAGMTGTADTEAAEFSEIYKLDVVVIPTNRPMIRIDQADVIYKTEQEKFRAVIDDIVSCHATGQPVLVGTITIENSEKLSELLKKRGVPHNVLNAKQHEREAEIVAQAGRKSAVTIATNMAGRGTDIVLGGNPEMMAKREAAQAEDPEEVYARVLDRAKAMCAAEKQEVLAAGGLYILGTERHESRRIDNQLRGRSGRQGDPGESRFYMSLEDDLLRIFGSHRVSFVMEKLKVPEGEAIEHGMISKAIEGAQKKVEAHNFEIRKHLIDYDDVMNRQREVIYTQRKEVLAGEQIYETIKSILDEMVEDMVGTFCPHKTPPTEWDWDTLAIDFANQFNFEASMPEPDKDLKADDLEENLKQQVDGRLQERTEVFTLPVMEHLMKVLLLQTIDTQWKDHLLSIDHLKEGIGMRAYAQRNPKEEYKREAYALFMEMMGRIRQEVTQKLFRVQLAREDEIAEMEAKQRRERLALARQSGPQPAVKEPVKRDADKVGRNDACPCGSGKKYKKCCGR
jgi:preprotein translocase subunit SecA